MEIIFDVRDSEDGGYCARALGYAIFTEAETREEHSGRMFSRQCRCTSKRQRSVLGSCNCTTWRMSYSVWKPR